MSSRAFRERSLADLNLEYFTDCALQLREVETEIKDGEAYGEARDQLERRRHALRTALGIEPESLHNILESDPLIAKWEAEYARGETPDLEEGADRGKRK